MFNKNFYPTPTHVLDMMGIDCYGLHVLEPSAGSGAIIDYLKVHAAKSVVACEIHPELATIIKSKAVFLKDNFFHVTSEDVSHIQMIVMNPPFDNADKHILHAWEVAPEGCEIIALCNNETIDNSYSNGRNELRAVLNTNGTYTNLGQVFSTAERKTDVVIGLIRLFKPIVSDTFDYDGFSYIDEESAGSEGVMPYNDVRAIVNTYVGAVKCFKEVEEISTRLSALTRGFGYGLKFDVNYNDKGVTTQQEFARAFQKYQWNVVFARLQIDKYLTKGVKADINKFVEGQRNYPFTMRNIYKMIDLIIGNREGIMERAIVEAVDHFTKHTHENRYHVEGWKTNEGHMLGQKFITGWICEPSFRGGLQIRTWQSNFADVEDLTKALCYITGTDYNQIPHIDFAPCIKTGDDYLVVNGKVVDQGAFQPNTWYEWGFFKFKLYKKGTGHFTFKDEKVWHALNQRYGKIKGFVLPEVIKTKKSNQQKQSILFET